MDAAEVVGLFLFLSHYFTKHPNIELELVLSKIDEIAGLPRTEGGNDDKG